MVYFAVVKTHEYVKVNSDHLKFKIIIYDVESPTVE